MSIWDDPELRSSSDYVKFENVGDTVTGAVLSVRAHRFDDGKVVPQILLDTVDGERTLTAGQVRLKAMLAEKRPEVGDSLSVTLTNVEKRAGGKTLKDFEVVVQRGAGAAPTPAPAAPADEGLTPEQVAAKKLLGLA